MSNNDGRAGFTIVETLVAILLLSIGVMAMGSLLARSSRLATASASTIYGTAAITTEVARLNALPFSLLPATGETCTAVTSAPYPHTRCTRVTDISATVKELRVRVTPTSVSVRSDTVTFRRSLPGGNPALTTP